MPEQQKILATCKECDHWRDEYDGEGWCANPKTLAADQQCEICAPPEPPFAWCPLRKEKP